MAKNRTETNATLKNMKIERHGTDTVGRDVSHHFSDTRLFYRRREMSSELFVSP